MAHLAQHARKPLRNRNDDVKEQGGKIVEKIRASENILICTKENTAHRKGICLVTSREATLLRVALSVISSNFDLKATR